MGRVQVEQVREAGVIAEAVRRIIEDSSLIAEARRNLAGALDRLGLSGTAREAVRPLLVAATSNGPYAHVDGPELFWLS